jgi:hypothetical protein
MVNSRFAGLDSLNASSYYESFNVPVLLIEAEYGFGESMDYTIDLFKTNAQGTVGCMTVADFGHADLSFDNPPGLWKDVAQWLLNPVPCE